MTNANGATDMTDSASVHVGRTGNRPRWDIPVAVWLCVAVIWTFAALNVGAQIAHWEDRHTTEALK